MGTVPSNTHEFPYGRDVDVLVVCRDRAHQKVLSEHLGLAARYVTFGLVS